MAGRNARRSEPVKLEIRKAWLVLLLLACGCVTEYEGIQSSHMDHMKLYSDKESHNFKPLLTRYNLDPPLSSDLPGMGNDEEPELFEPYHRFSTARYLSSDGSISVHYYLEAGTAGMVATLLVSHVPGLMKVLDSQTHLATNQVTVFPKFIQDNRRTAGVGTTPFSKYGTVKGAVQPRFACDLLVVKADKGKLMEAEEFIARLLTEIPQIELKVRIIEVKLEDDFEFGVDQIITKQTTGQSFLNTEFVTDETTGEIVVNENTGLWDVESGGWTTKFDTESFLVSGVENFQGTIFHVAGVHNKLALDAFIEMVQRTTESQILSAPKLTVLSGHKAVIETGSKIPVQEAQIAINQTTFKYVYQPTGVKLVMLPTLLMDETIEIEINLEVNTITGQETVVTPTSTFNIPVFTTRNVTTKVTVKDGEALAMGGLLARAEIERVQKVPLLGDIPLLGYLFKSRSKELKETEIIFYVEPRIVKPGESLYMPE
jgi:type II secretory pathway component GspD/PulD (secretin)